MPIYEYQCQECGHQLEVIRKISDPPLQDCPECGRPALKKKVSAPVFRLKGGGWYETDFKSGDKKKNLAGDTKEAGAATADTKSDKSDGKKGAAADSGKGSGAKDSKPAGDGKSKPSNQAA